MEFVKSMHQKYLKFNHRMKIQDVFSKLEHFIDVSDPDISLPNYYHGIQTAEAIRKDEHPEWLQLVGLIHDLGKIMYLWGNDQDGTKLHLFSGCRGHSERSRQGQLRGSHDREP